MSHRITRVVLVFSALGYPLTQMVIRRFGRTGAQVAEAVCTGLLVRDIALIATGTPSRLRRGPALLLWLEAVVAASAVATGIPPAVDHEACRQTSARRPTRSEIVRRTTVGALFGVHTTRFWIYTRPDHGGRAETTT